MAAPIQPPNREPDPGDAPDQDFERLVTLFHLVEGAWALARFEDGTIRRRVIADLRAALAPIPLLEVSLAGITPDPLAILRGLPDAPDQPAPVVAFTGVSGAFPDLCGYLDLQRETLALQPQRLLLWVTDYDWRFIAEHAPNFYSRISGVFHFPGTSGTRIAAGGNPRSASRMPDSGSSRPAHHRPLIPARDERERERLIAQQQRRIAELRRLPHPDDQALGDSWYDLGGLYDEAKPYRWSESEAAYVEAARHYAAAGNTAAQASALYEAGRSANRAYATTAALEHLNYALTRYRLLENRQGEADVLLALGDVQQFRDECEAAQASYEAALALFRALGSRLGEANVLKAIGDVQQFRDEREAALESYQHALTLFRAVGDRLGEANVFMAIGDMQQFRDEREAALESYQHALTLFRAVGDRLGEANVLKAIGDVQQFRKEMEAALENYQHALTLFRAVGAKLGEANVLMVIGDVQQFRKEMEAALENYQHALTLFRTVGDRLGEANVLSGRARLALIADQYPRAEELLEQALDIFRAIGDRYSIALQSGRYGLTLRRLGRADQARPYFQQAAEFYTAIGMLDRARRFQELDSRRTTGFGLARRLSEAMKSWYKELFS